MVRLSKLSIGVGFVLASALAHAQTSDASKSEGAAGQAERKFENSTPRMSTNVTTAKEQAPPAEVLEPSTPVEGDAVKATKSRSNIQNN